MTLNNTLSLSLSFLVALSALALGCEIPETSEADAFPLDKVPYSTLTAGTNGSNHLGSDDYHANAETLFESTKDNLLTWDAGHNRYEIKNNTSNNSLLATAGGREALKYAIRCALPDGAQAWYVLNGQDASFEGQGILTNQDWGSSALSLGEAETLYACVAAHMNGMGETVPIFLMGQEVSTADDIGDFEWLEALWAVDISVDANGDWTGITYHAFPHGNPGASQDCPHIINGIESRICGNTPNCGLQIHSDWRADEDCYENDRLWSCSLSSGGPLVPMIETRLLVSDVEILYPEVSSCM